MDKTAEPITATYYKKVFKQLREIRILINADSPEDADKMWEDSSAFDMLESYPEEAWAVIEDTESNICLASEDDLENGKHLSEIEMCC